MRILLDTNIVIHREAGRVVNQDIGLLFSWLDRLHYHKCIHNLTIDELRKNPNLQTVATMEIKLQSYVRLLTEAPLHENVEALSVTVDRSDNDVNDTRLLNELYSGRVDFLITEDKQIHYKAKALGIGDKVYRINSFLQKVIAENPDFVDYSVLSVKRELFGNINLSDGFFDNFRLDYPGFDSWYHRKAGGNERAYVCYEAEILKAFLFLKVETEEESYGDITPAFAKKRRLKIGTFKVSSNGLRIGERFLKIVFDNARLYKVDEIYVTIFDHRPELLNLIALLEKFGFKLFGRKDGPNEPEKVFVRIFEKRAVLDNPKMTYPWLSRNGRVYIVPIKPEYHTELFPDSKLRTESALDFVENEPHRNGISKSYVTHSKTRNLKSGDILIFYRSGGIHKGVATTIGIVEQIFADISDEEELASICRKRSALKNEELHEYWNRFPTLRPFVVNFLYAFSFKQRQNLRTMLDQGIFANMDTVKTITEIPFESLKRLIILSGI